MTAGTLRIGGHPVVMSRGVQVILPGATGSEKHGAVLGTDWTLLLDLPARRVRVGALLVIELGEGESTLRRVADVIASPTHGTLVQVEELNFGRGDV